MQIKTFVFNPFQVNTYLIYDNKKKAILIDPAMMSSVERYEFKEYVEKHQIKLNKVLFTHGHIDHIAGSAWIKKEFGLSPAAHPADDFLINTAEAHAQSFGIEIEHPAAVSKKIEHGDTIQSSNITLHCRLVPGHSRGSIAFLNNESRSVFNGDTLFAGSIGRTDLPGGNYDELIHSIKEQLMSLTPDFTLYPGHGPKSSIANEMADNPFIQG